MTGKASDLLPIALSAAVPFWIIKLKDQTAEYRQQRANACCSEIAHHGDRILYATEGTAEAFNRLAEGIACLAFQPGGVTAFGRHWEAKGW